MKNIEQIKAPKGVIMAGGSGSRLSPVTKVVSKHLLPIFDKPMIFYPLSVLFLAGVKEVLIVVNEIDLADFQAVLGTGEKFGVSIVYKTQSEPKGIADGFSLISDFVQDSTFLFALGDNLFFGNDFVQMLGAAVTENQGATIFLQHVTNASQLALPVLTRMVT